MSNQPLVLSSWAVDSDLDIMREAGKALEELGIAYEIDVTSAHRSPDRTADFARKAAAAEFASSSRVRVGRASGRYDSRHTPLSR